MNSKRHSPKQGTVSRGIAKIEEHHQIEKKLSGEIKNNHRTFEPTSAVSMNFWGFTPFISDFRIQLLPLFRKENLNSQEKLTKIEVNILKTKAEWFGLTYLAK